MKKISTGMDKKGSFGDDSDLDQELNEFEPSDSDDDYEDNEKLLLERARSGKALDDEDDDDEDDADSEEEVFGIYSSEGEDDKKNADSDIEGMEDDDKLPDSKAWGKRKRDYYYTDYVDHDHPGFEREEEAEAASMEEKEARTLQSRLAKELDNVDLSFGLISTDVNRLGDSGDADEKEEEGDLDGDIIKTDLSKLSKRERLALFKKESPEFFGLVNDYNERLTFASDKLFPIMKLIKCGDIPFDLPCAKFVEIKTNLTLNYCVNLAFYLVLKKKRVRVKDHPVIGRLVKYRTLLQKMDELQSSEFVEQLNYIVERLKANKRVRFISDSSDSKKLKRNKTKLKLLSSSDSVKSDNKKKEDSLKVKSKIDVDDGDNFGDLLSDNESGDEDDNEPPNKKSKSADRFEVDEKGKRPITFEIAKNKGLTPHRKKEQRNPRVKHRNKYRKTLIRRKGQVRQVKNESSKYGGEIFGIKASVIKSRRFK